MEIKPFLGIGNIKFETSRSDIRKFLGPDFTSFKKTSFSINETDAYETLGIFLFYDANDNLDFIETFSPCTPVFKGISLIEYSLDDLKEKLINIGAELVSNDAGYDIPNYGFGLYVIEDKIDGVCIYTKNYYEEG